MRQLDIHRRGLMGGLMANSSFLFLTVFLVAFKVCGAIPIQQSAFEKKNRYIEHGVFIGGYDRGAQSLAGIRENFDKESKIERIVLDVTPPGPTLHAGRPGFFHVSVQKAPKRVLIDLQNVSGGKYSEERIKKVFEKSKYFFPPKIYTDTLTKNLTLELPMKEQGKVEVFELAGVDQPGRIVIDVKGP